MTPKLLQAQDLASGSYALILVAMLASTVLLLAGTAWAPRRWKLAIGLCGITTLVSALHYWMSYEVWLATGQMTVIHRYVGWFLSVPLQVVTLYFFVRAFATLPLGLFWRLLAAAVLLVLARFMGEAGFMHATLGFLLALAFWLYILGEAFFGPMSERTAKEGSSSVQRGYFWIRLVMTIGWAVYPLCYFIAAFSGGVEVRNLIVTYNLADFVNQIGFGLAVLTVGLNANPARD